MKKIIRTSDAPAAIGPYSQAVSAGSMTFLSGMLGIDPKTGMIAGASAAEQAEQIFRNIDSLLHAAGLSQSDVVKTTVFLKDLQEFGAVNEVYGRYFTSDYPARSCVEVSRLPKDALIEVECIAVKGE